MALLRGPVLDLLGRTVTEAICTDTGRDGAARPAAANCNALLKVAGKC